MKISFHGAARTVTGSKHLLTLNNGKKVLFDCGLFQGLGQRTNDLNDNFGFDPKEVDYLLLSHAHIDHSGLIPKLVKEGFSGPIYCTSATKDLAQILLLDSAEIQIADTNFVNKTRERQGIPGTVKPLYDVDDVKKALPLFVEVAYDNWKEIEPGVDVLFTDAGHIIGSASVHLRVSQGEKPKQITFSGDIGRYRDIILRSPETFSQSDIIIIESTYGNSVHNGVCDTVDMLCDWTKRTCVDKKGKLIIPAFSVGRTQELLYFFNQLSLEKRLPHIPVYVDSPLSNEATQVVKHHTEGFNSRIKKLMKIDSDPFDFPGLKFITSVEESKALNENPAPCVILSASGMADAGRVKHHIKNNISERHNTILIVGYCEPHSLGGRLMNGAKEVRIFGMEYKVKAEVGVMRSMSAHGDYEDLCQFLSCQNPKEVEKLFIVHGEYDVQMDFQSRLLRKGFNDVEVPELHQEFGI